MGFLSRIIIYKNVCLFIAINHKNKLIKLSIIFCNDLELINLFYNHIYL